MLQIRYNNFPRNEKADMKTKKLEKFERGISHFHFPRTLTTYLLEAHLALTVAAIFNNIKKVFGDIFIAARLMKKIIFYTLTIMGILTVSSVLLSTQVPPSSAFRIIFGGAFVLFLPGYAWSHVLFEQTAIQSTERIVISAILSVNIVPLVIYLLNKTGMPITPLSTLAGVTVSICFAIGILLFTRPKNSKQVNTLKFHQN